MGITNKLVSIQTKHEYYFNYQNIDRAVGLSFGRMARHLYTFFQEVFFFSFLRGFSMECSWVNYHFTTNNDLNGMLISSSTS